MMTKERRKALRRAWYLQHREEQIAYAREYRRKFPERHRELNKKYRERNKEKCRLSHRRIRLRTYGLTLEQEKAIRLTQENRCAICSGIKKLVPDHNHVTKKFRGMLCYGCNTALGVFKADKDMQLLEKAIRYIKKNA